LHFCFHLVTKGILYPYTRWRFPPGKSFYYIYKVVKVDSFVSK